MPVVSRCVISQCAYNLNKGCHAKAITVGDGHIPNCDSFVLSETHVSEIQRIAGVGACKVSDCLHNSSFECNANSIQVGVVGQKFQCLTYSSRLEQVKAS